MSENNEKTRIPVDIWPEPTAATEWIGLGVPLLAVAGCFVWFIFQVFQGLAGR